jgi:hypothetical protein
MSGTTQGAGCQAAYTNQPAPASPPCRARTHAAAHLKHTVGKGARVARGAHEAAPRVGAHLAAVAHVQRAPARDLPDVGVGAAAPLVGQPLVAQQDLEAAAERGVFFVQHAVVHVSAGVADKDQSILFDRDRCR